MPKPILTFGCPVYDDFKGLWATIQSFAIHHAHIARRTQVIVSNDNPNSAEGQASRKFIEYWAGRKFHSVLHLNHDKPMGPAASKNDIFLHATADVVAVSDAHVLFPTGPEFGFKPGQGVFDSILNWFEKHPQDMDLHSGVNPLDDLDTKQTELIRMVRGEMLGIWHANPQGFDPKNPPYEVWGNGCGFLVCRKFAWLGFNPHFKGFGGEEGYIHEKYRLAGRKVVNHPSWQWLHRYEAPGVTFPRTREVKVRNMVLGKLELGQSLDPLYEHFVSLGHPNYRMCPACGTTAIQNCETCGGEGRIKVDVPDPLESLKRHLVEEHSVDQALFFKDGRPANYDELQLVHRRFKIPEENWRYLIADPINHYTPESLEKQEKGMVVEAESLPQMLHKALNQPRDLNEHLSKLIEFSKDCEVIEDVTRRVESTVAMISTTPAKMHTILFGDDASDRTLEQLVRVVPGEVKYKIEAHQVFPEDAEIEECDLLFFKCPHNFSAVQTYTLLDRWLPKIKRYIVLHDTNRGKWEDTQVSGPIEGIKNLLNNRKNWFVKYHNRAQWGFTVLGCQEVDKPEAKVHAWEPGYGPGSELKAITEALGVEEKPDCACNAIRIEMDLLGVAGCRKLRDNIVTALQENSKNWNWAEKFEMAAKLATGPEWKLAWKLDLNDIYGSLFDIVVDRAEKKEQALAKALESK